MAALLLCSAATLVGPATVAATSVKVKPPPPFNCPPVYVFDAPKKHPHSKQVIEILESEFKRVGVKCRVTLVPVYTKKGDLTEKLITKAARRIHANGASAKKPVVVHLSFNLRSTDKTKSLEEILKRLSKPGILITGPAGENPDETNVPLKIGETVLGQIPRIVLIGELTVEGNLAPRSNYGPEMLTALKPPEGLAGSSFSAPLATARLALKLAASTPEKLLKAVKKSKGAAVAGGATYPTLEQLGL